MNEHSHNELSRNRCKVEEMLLWSTADAHHLMTDVWTSVGVVAALVVVMLAPPSWPVLDPLIAFVLGLNIIRTGISRKAFRRGLDGHQPAGR